MRDVSLKFKVCIALYIVGVNYLNYWYISRIKLKSKKLKVVKIALNLVSPVISTVSLVRRKV